jgi:hypothetical protein
MKIEEMYDCLTYLHTNYDAIQKEHPKLINAFNFLSAMLCAHMPEHDIYSFAFPKDVIFEFINKTVAVYSYNSEDEMLIVSVSRRPEVTLQ